jgi:cytoskeleton protein RodZ
MEGEDEAPEVSLFPATVGDKLRTGREAQGIDLAEVAGRTRIPQRHLEAIEKSNYSALPSITYAVGFAKSYARAIGVDEVAIARELRAELGRAGPERSPPMPSYDAIDPARSPTGGAVWIGLVVAVLVLVGAGIWYGTGLFRGTAPAPETLTLPEETPVTENIGDAVPVAGGQVSLIAREAVWLRVTDGNGNRLFERELQAGERYDVPADAVRPVARTGRADAIQVTLNGSNVPDLGPGSETVEAEVSADAIRTRGTTPATPASSPSRTPARTSAAPPPAPAADALSVSGNATAP